MDILLTTAIRPARPALVAAGDGADSHTPPQGAVSNAKRALELIADGKAGKGFTDVGRARAKQLAAGTAVSTSVVRKMHAYFARHAKGDQGAQDQAGTPANVAWLAWGGDAGKRWVDSIVSRLDEAMAASGELVAVRDGDTWRFDTFSDVEDLGTEALPSDELAATTAAAIPVSPPAEWFDDPGLTEPTALTVTADGRVYGHAASWGVRHIGLPGHRTAPHSSTGYRYFRTGQVETADGSMVATGRITMGAGHADLNGNLTAASEHYDNVCAAVADVACGEDAHGIWFAGALRPEVTPSQVRTLRASSLSGDWRPAGNALEMVGLLAVNVPGFPTPRAALAASGEAVCALVAAGVITRTVEVEPTELVLTDDDPFDDRFDVDDPGEPVTAAGRHGPGPYRFRHGWIPLDGTRDDRPDTGRGSEAVRSARSEARQRLDAALSRLEKVSPEGARRQRAVLNELRESGKLTPDRMRIATNAANRAALPSGHARAESPTEGLGADRFGPGKPAAPAKPRGGPDVRGDSRSARLARRNLDDLRGATGDNRTERLRKMPDAELRNTHEAARAQHTDAQGAVAKAQLKQIADDIKAEHSRRKAERAKTTAASGALVAATAEDGSQVPDSYYSKTSSSKNTGKASKSSRSGGSSSWDGSKHPRQPEGASNGGQFAPAGGAGKDAAGRAAQQNKTAQGNYLALDKLKGADAAKFLKGLSDKDLRELTELAYSAKSSDKKVVANRLAVAKEMGDRGIDIKKHGALGGGRTGATRASAHQEEPIMSDDIEPLDELTAAGDDMPRDPDGVDDAPTGYDPGSSVALGDTGIVGHVVDSDDTTGQLTVEVTMAREDVQPADSDQAMAASARRTDAAKDRARDRSIETLSATVASLAASLDERSAEVTRLVEDRRARESDALLADLPG